MYEKSNANAYRGIAPFADNDASHKEMYDFGLDRDQISESERHRILYEQTPHPFPGTDEGKKFKEFCDQHFDIMLKLGIRLLGYIAKGMGYEPDYFEKWFVKDSLSTFRLIHNGPRSESIVK